MNSIGFEADCNTESFLTNTAIHIVLAFNPNVLKNNMRLRAIFMT